MPNSAQLRLESGGGAAPDFSKGSIFFVGTATVILRYAGFTILTDPNFLHAGDHFDRVAEERLRKDLPIITTEHAASELKDKGFTAPTALGT